MNRTRMLAVSLMGILSASCSNSSHGNNTSVIRLESISSTLASEACRQLFECEGIGGDARSIALLAGDQATCVSVFGAQLAAEGDTSSQVARANAGELTYDGAKARECINSLGCAFASGASLEPPVCREVFVGNVAAGSACNSHDDCAGTDMYCYAEVARTCPGVCQAGVAQGGACNGDRECSTLGGTISPICDYGSGGSGGTCKTGALSTVSDGAVCGRVVTATTVTNASCASGFYCDRSGNTDGNGVCHAYVAAGGACSSSDACADGTLCVNDVCAVPPIVNTAGGACANSDAGPFCNPFHRLRCGDSNTCEAVPGTGAVGDQCTTGDFSIACSAGNYCDDTTNLCAAAKANGAACTQSDECSSRNCDFSSGPGGTCAAANTCRL